MTAIYILLGLLLLIFMFYMVIPNYIARNKSKEVIRTINKKTNKTIALTFDDGPDPLYTNRLLDILEKNEIKATFFLVAQKAQENQDIVYRMKKDGHGIGMHTMYHKSAWLSFPWETINEFKKGLKILEGIGLNITYYRPPWGTFNAFTLKHALKNKLKIILWSVEAYDWRKNNSATNIEDILLRRIEEGDIIVLHDSGGALGAPNNTLEALESTIPKLKNLGYNFITIDEMIKG